MRAGRSRIKGHCALCGRYRGNSTRKWTTEPKAAHTEGRSRRVNRKVVVARAMASYT